MNRTAKNIHRRRGMTAMLAMLFLVLFSSLAVGFYAATNTSMQVTSNEQKAAIALTAAESGMQFLKYQLAHVTIPPTTTDPAAVMDKLCADLKTQMEGTGNLGALTISESADHSEIKIPAETDQTIKLDGRGDTAFSASIKMGAGGTVKAAIHGYYGGASSAARGIEIDFTRVEHEASVFDYAVASKGQVVAKKGTVTGSTTQPTIATVMSELASSGAISMTGGTIGGDLNYVNGGSVSVSGGSVGGTSNVTNIMNDHVHMVSPPEFPTIDPTIFKQYAVNSWVNQAKVQQNIRIPAGSNPKFNANDTVQGIMYVESPNQVTFVGDFKLQGFIVFESGVAPNDWLKFSGNLTMSSLPNGVAFDPLRQTSGIAILAPNAAANFTGSSGGNIVGNLIVKSFNFAGAADLTIDLGTLMTLNPNTNATVFNGAKTVKFNSTGATNQPSSGLSYSSYFEPIAQSYRELLN